MLNELFTSKTRVEILKLFLTEKDLQIHLREVARRTDSEVNAVKRELENLEKIGFLHSRKEIQRKYYEIDKKFEFLEELRSIFWKRYSILQDVLEERFEGMKSVFVTANYINNPKSLNDDNKSEIDIVFIGEIGLNRLEEFMQKSERKFERVLNYTILSEVEWNLKLNRRDPQVLNWLLNENVRINLHT